jgi:hypothetical protein
MAGTLYVDGRIPGQRIATTVRTSDSSAFVSETEVDSVTAPLVSGRTYRIRHVAKFSTDSADTLVVSRIREDSVTGTALSNHQTNMGTTSAFGFTLINEVEFTATATGNKTFSATGNRNGGSGNITAEATATAPTYLYVDYIR